jgi:predicted cobalt transporter CbtA
MTNRQRALIIVWLVVAVVVFNGIYDFMMTRSVKEYLLREYMFQAGRGPKVPLAASMDLAVRNAFWISTLWASSILLAGLITIRAHASADPRLESHG